MKSRGCNRDGRDSAGTAVAEGHWTSGRSRRSKEPEGETRGFRTGECLNSQCPALQGVDAGAFISSTVNVRTRGEYPSRWGSVYTD